MTVDQLWLAANYHFPATYSCRMPLSSMSSALATPGPGPGTVRLALIRAGCEVFGAQTVREELFPIIRTAQIHIRPPERVAVSQQMMQGYKVRHSEAHTAKGIVKSLQYRDVAHAQGELTIYLQVPGSSTQSFRELFMAIGYWGQTDSLTACLLVEDAVPDWHECALPLRRLPPSAPLGACFTCILTEFRKSDLSWEEVVGNDQLGEQDPLQREVYVWPMLLAERRATSMLLVRQPFKAPL